MIRNLLSLSLVVGVLMLFSCADDNLSPILTFDKVGKGAYVRLLQETDNKVISLFDPTNFSYTYSVEFVDLEKGTTVSEYCLNLTVKDNTEGNADVSKGPIQIKCFSASDFGSSAGGFKGIDNITLTSSELFALAGVNPDDLGPGDEFKIIGIITTTEGATFGAANSSAAVNGSAFQGHFDFTFPATCPSNLAGTYAYTGTKTWCGNPAISGNLDIVALGGGVYALSDWSIGSYAACYGEGNVADSQSLTFTDVCNEVFFSGFTDAFGDVWEYTSSSIEGTEWTITYVNTYGEGGTGIIINPDGWPITLR